MVVIVDQTKANSLFLIIAGLGGISSICRSDYNLPLFIFVWWSYFNFPESQKSRQQRFIRRFILLSCLQDIIYILYWSPLWFSMQWKTNEPSTFGSHILIIIIAVINLFLKLITLFVLKGGTGFASNQVIVYNNY
ncbi:uncharacterized protein cubi_00775 [Cryptosporidium ubiquitum]|uniref:Transmembrane protein n=1 Tax=Cryptosporidium ubiquitum TaxID=857276 RepID=A0A1J4MEW5_9CRYT|nr:uncharacterized protein cubi_00775 [Cryptosporidium ubiquitum]OII71397.1 hypothetical protein cubi_00775 [Cryptosporidium ubiquitum]